LAVPSFGIPDTLTLLPSLKVKMPPAAWSAKFTLSLIEILLIDRPLAQSSCIHGFCSPDDAHPEKGFFATFSSRKSLLNSDEDVIWASGAIFTNATGSGAGSDSDGGQSSGVLPHSLFGFAPKVSSNCPPSAKSR